MSGDINFTGTRTKSSPTNSLPIGIIAPAVVANDTDNTLLQMLQLDSLTPSPPTFTAASCATTNGSPTVTGANFGNVRKGDAVTGTGIAGGTTVSNVVGNTLTLSQNATATNTVTLTFTPPTLNVNLMAFKHSFTVSGSEVTITTLVYVADGTSAYGTTDDLSTPDDDSGYTEVRKIITKIDIDTVMTNARAART